MHSFRPKHIKPNTEGGEGTSAFVFPSAAIAWVLSNFRCKHSSHKRPSKFLTTQLWSLSFNHWCLCAETHRSGKVASVVDFLSSLWWSPLLTWLTEHGRHMLEWGVILACAKARYTPATSSAVSTRSNQNNKASFLKNCLGGLLARLIQVLDTTDVCLVAS